MQKTFLVALSKNLLNWVSVDTGKIIPRQGFWSIFCSGKKMWRKIYLVVLRNHSIQLLFWGILEHKFDLFIVVITDLKDENFTEVVFFRQLKFSVFWTGLCSHSF